MNFHGNSSFRVERPDCPNCGTERWLTRIDPDEPDHDRRTYECPACQSIKIIVVNTYRPAPFSGAFTSHGLRTDALAAGDRMTADADGSPGPG